MQRATLTPPPALAKSAKATTVLEVALPLAEEGQEDAGPRRTYPVCAYLPLRDSGLRFILQADWDVTAARNQVKEDSAWNQWLRDSAPGLIADALEAAQGAFAPDELLRLVPAEDEAVEPWFRPVLRGVFAELRARPCLRSVDGHLVKPAQPTPATHRARVQDRRKVCQASFESKRVRSTFLHDFYSTW